MSGTDLGRMLLPDDPPFQMSYSEDVTEPLQVPPPPITRVRKQIRNCESKYETAKANTEL
eukprot:2070830-Rhodomonas_salina.2